MLRKNLDRCNYILLLISLWSAYLIVKILTIFSFVFSKTKKGDVIFFPHEQIGSDGYTKRFEQYFPFFNKDKIVYHVAELFPDAYIKRNLFGSKSRQYYLYHRIIWKRIPQVLSARKYKHAFIHRRLFAYYPDSKKAHLEKLLRKLNEDISVDFWDSVWLKSPELYEDIVIHVDKISVVNQFVYDHFKKYPTKKYLFPIAIDESAYVIKKSFAFEKEIKLVWTGLPHSVLQIMALREVFLKILEKYPIAIVIISAKEVQIEGLKVLWKKWEKETFANIIASCDIALYPFENTDEGKGKMAMKVIEYMACGVPTIGANVGITPYAKDNETILFAETHEEWYNAIIKLIEDEALRMKISKNGLSLVAQYHSVKLSYNTFKEIIFSN